MSKASRLLIVSAALAALGLADARAATDQSAPTNDSSSATEHLQEVTVTAQRAKLAERISAFVSKITGPLFEGGLPLWGKPVCPLVSGLPREEGEFIVGRVSDVARAGGGTARGRRMPPQPLHPGEHAPAGTVEGDGQAQFPVYVWHFH